VRCFGIAKAFRIPLRWALELDLDDLEVYGEWFDLEKKAHEAMAKDMERKAEAKRKRESRR
jgi:hypothetical protein